jgi:hypothetical protein
LISPTIPLSLLEGIIIIVISALCLFCGIFGISAVVCVVAIIQYCKNGKKNGKKNGEQMEMEECVRGNSAGSHNHEQAKVTSVTNEESNGKYKISLTICISGKCKKFRTLITLSNEALEHAWFKH